MQLASAPERLGNLTALACASPEALASPVGRGAAARSTCVRVDAGLSRTERSAVTPAGLGAGSPVVADFVPVDVLGMAVPPAEWA